jgi:hypothetical protein
MTRTIAYDGSQLRSHWIMRSTRIAGDAMVAFRGPCDVSETEMADLEDALAGAAIRGADMVHFVAERFDDGDLDRAVLRQRLLAARALELLRAMGKRSAKLVRMGDDLFAGRRKLSISVATRSAVSTLLHFAVNVSNAGTPVPTASLQDLGVEPEQFARALLAATRAEESSITAARCKVRPRGGT